MNEKRSSELQRLKAALRRQRKLAEEKLRQSEEKFSKAFRLAPVGMTITTLSDGKFVEMNEAVERLSGYLRDEVIGHSAFEFNIWQDPYERARVISEVTEKGEVREREMIMKDKEGRTFWGSYSAVTIDIDGRKHLLSLVSDIGERKRALEALQESEERFRLLAENAPVLIWVTGKDSRCTYFNKTRLEFTGKRLEEGGGDGCKADIHPDDFDRCVGTYLSAFNERRKFNIEYRLRRASGEYGWIVDTGVPRLSASGDLLGFIGTGFDITEQKRVKDELQQANQLLAQRVAERTAELTESIEKLQGEINERIRMQQALQAETTERINAQSELREKELLLLHQSRLAAMGEMIGNIAHQWRQPLNSLALVVQDIRATYKNGTFDIEYLDESVDKMVGTIRHMSQTINDFTDFFRPMKEKVEFSVLDVLKKTLSLLEGSFQSQQIQIEIAAPSDPLVTGYPNEFSQVLLNIMMNARDAFCTHEVASPLITIEVAKTRKGKCLLTITDNAGGIPEEIMDKIFDPYFTTKGPEKGTGVGLFMSRTIIEKKMGGTLTARNAGKGAQFQIEV